MHIAPYGEKTENALFSPANTLSFGFAFSNRYTIFSLYTHIIRRGHAFDYDS